MICLCLHSKYACLSVPVYECVCACACVFKERKREREGEPVVMHDKSVVVGDSINTY